MEKLEEEKEKQVLKIKTKLVPATEARITEAKKTKQKIGNYKNIKSKTEEGEKEMEKMKRKGQEVKGSQISLNVSQNKSTMVDVGKDIKDEIMKYEADRIEINKQIMLLLINYEMAYHTKYIEELTKLFAEIKGEDLTKSIKQSVISVGVSQNVSDDDDDNNNEEESEKNDDENDDEDDENLKTSKLNKSKKASVRKSKKSEKKDDDDSDDEIEKDNDK